MDHATKAKGRHGSRGPWSLRLYFGLITCFSMMTILIQHVKVSSMFPSHPDIETDIVIVGNKRAEVESKTASRINITITTPQNQNQDQLNSLLSKYDLSFQAQSTVKINIPDANRSIAFLHIGKTGGSTISMHIRKGCQESYMKPCNNRKDGWILNETAASHLIQKYYHRQDIPNDHQFTTIMTVVRNPLSRFLSAFAYEHPTNSFATGINLHMNEKQKYSCFPSVSYLIKAAVGRAEIPWNKSHLQRIRDKNSACFTRECKIRMKTKKEKIAMINCTELAEVAFGVGSNQSWAVVNESHPWVNHMSFGYRQYYRSMPPNKELIVLRHGHLWDDWVQVNHLLSREYEASKVWPEVPPFQEISRNESSKYHMKSRWEVETDQEQQWLCQLLHEEIRTYLMILMRAVNLDEDDLLEAVKDIEKMCTVPFLSDATASATMRMLK